MDIPTNSAPKPNVSTSQQRLGKGLAALISEGTISSQGYNANFEIDRIIPNPFQPRMNIDPDNLIQMADSIREHGVIQPLLITKDNNSVDKYYLIAGERRWRASQLAGLKTVPVVIKEISQQEMLELALIENIQRQDLNPLEEAIAFKQLVTDFGMTHGDISKKVGLNRVTVTNKIRLLILPESVREYVLNNQVTEGHARALLGIEDMETIEATANIVVRRNLTVRETENLVRKINFGKQANKHKIESLSEYERNLSKKLSEALGLKIKVNKLSNGGRIIIKFHDDEQFEAIVDQFIANPIKKKAPKYNKRYQKQLNAKARKLENMNLEQEKAD